MESPQKTRKHNISVCLAGDVLVNYYYGNS